MYQSNTYRNMEDIDLEIQEITSSLIDLIDNKNSVDILSGSFTRENIDRFYNEGFNENIGYSQVGSYDRSSASGASGLYKSMIGRIAGVLYSKFPQYKTSGKYSTQIDSIIEDNRINLDNLLREASVCYIKYGSCFIDIEQDKLKILDLGNNISILRDDFSTDIAIKVNENLSDSLISYFLDLGYLSDVKDYDNERFDIYYYQGCRFVDLIEKIVFIDRLYNNNLFIYDNKPFVAYVYKKFKRIEDIEHKSDALTDALKFVVVTSNANKKSFEKLVNASHGEVVTVDASGGFDAGVNKLYDVVDQSSNIALHQALQQISESYFNDIVKILDIQDLFINKAENPNESTISAQNRIQVSQVNHRAKQNKFFNFIDDVITAFVLHVLRKENPQISVKDIDLEINSVSILDEQEKEASKISNQSQINQLLLQIQQVSIDLVPIYLGMLKEIISNNDFSDEYKQSIELVMNNLLSSKSNIQPNPLQQLEMQGKQLENAKKQAEINKINTDSSLMEQKVETEKSNAISRQIEDKIRAEKHVIDVNRSILPNNETIINE